MLYISILIETINIKQRGSKMANIFNIGKTKPIIELDNRQLIGIAPSIGQTLPHADVSEKYSFVKTTDAINLLRDAGYKPISAREGKVLKHTRDGFQRHSISFLRDDLDLGARRLGLNLYNSHDRGSAFIISGFIQELVCANGLVIGKNAAEYRHRHVNFEHDIFVESAKFMAEKMDKIGHRIENWENIELEEQEAFIFANAARTFVNEGKDHIGTEASDFLKCHHYGQDSNSLWHVFNRIQENAIKGGIPSVSARGRRSATRGITNIHRDKEINQGLWNMAEHIAEVKQAA